jgi:hypothetical protein
MDVWAVFSQATQEGGAGISGWSFHGTLYATVLVVQGFRLWSSSGPQVGAVAGAPLRGASRLHAAFAAGVSNFPLGFTSFATASPDARAWRVG